MSISLISRRLPAFVILEVYNGNAGGGQGIGRAFAHALGEAGAAVAVVDINSKAAAEVAEELSVKGIRAIALTADVTKAKDCQRFVPALLRTPVLCHHAWCPCPCKLIVC
jgi:NAD(P)-dependent dehydrogenase (short-subunit alcohol dehydrogenase family)